MVSGLEMLLEQNYVQHLSVHITLPWLGESLYTWPDLRSLILGYLTVQLEKLAQYMFLGIYVLYQQGYFLIREWGEQSKCASITSTLYPALLKAVLP